MTDKHATIQPDRDQQATPIHVIDKVGLEDFLKNLPGSARTALAAQKFAAAPFEHAIIPNGDDWAVVTGVADAAELGTWCLARLGESLPGGTYRLVNADSGPALFGWAAGQYRFDRYRAAPCEESPRVLLTKAVSAIEPIMAEVAATALVRDMVNTPAEDMGPAQIEAEVERVAKANKAEVKVTSGDALEQGFPMVHAVGRAAARQHAPRLIELTWGDPRHPKLAIVGKGVCFDSGGLDIKPASGMALMKKDMGGAAHALALAQLVMQQHLKVRLHLLIPAVENAIAGNAFRPGDVLRSRKGLSVEIGNTDAEGRLVLGDALTRAGEEDPELVIDFATLTGAARVAVGPDLPALFTRHDETAADMIAAGDRENQSFRELGCTGGTWFARRK